MHRFFSPRRLHSRDRQRAGSGGIHRALGRHTLKKGLYCYIGSARGGIAGRVRRHVRLSRSKRGGGKWHIDSILKSPGAEVADAVMLPGADECAVSTALASHDDAAVPVARFGSSGCRSGCPAHLYRLASCAAFEGQKTIELIRSLLR